MRVLLTGASGFLGRYVLECLQQQGIETVLLGRQPPPHTNEWIATDLLTCSDFIAPVQQANATHLLHLAWYTEHGQYWSSPLNLRWVDATTRLTEAFCQTGGQRVVVAGTCAEYDWSHGYCREESTPLRPATLYGIAKDATRRLVAAICEQHQVSCAWGRVFLPFGTGESPQRLIPSLIAALRGQREAFGIHIEAYRDFLHAADVAAGLITLLSPTYSGVYNISSGQPVQLATLVCQLAELLQADPEPILALGQKRPHEPSLLVGECQRLQAVGWCPALTLRQALHHTIEESP